LKFRLLERNLWDDYDHYIGKKRHYKVDIAVAYRPNHDYYNQFKFTIITPEDVCWNTLKSGIIFESLVDAMAYVENWIDEDLKFKN
jgi:hypothetical protein